MYDDAMPGCGACNFDGRFCVSLLPRHVKAVTQILGSFSGGREGQKNALVSCICPCQLIFRYTRTVGLFLGSFLASTSAEAWHQWTKRRPEAISWSSLIEVVPICQVSPNRLQSMGHWIPINGSQTSWATLALVGSMRLQRVDRLHPISLRWSALVESPVDCQGWWLRSQDLQEAPPGA